jgi:hypothetical protein
VKTTCQKPCQNPLVVVVCRTHVSIGVKPNLALRSKN